MSHIFISSDSYKQYHTEFYVKISKCWMDTKVMLPAVGFRSSLTASNTVTVNTVDRVAFQWTLSCFSSVEEYRAKHPLVLGWDPGWKSPQPDVRRGAGMCCSQTGWAPRILSIYLVGSTDNRETLSQSGAPWGEAEVDLLSPERLNLWGKSTLYCEDQPSFLPFWTIILGLFF